MDSLTSQDRVLRRDAWRGIPAWASRNPLPVLLCLQAGLTFPSLGLLPLWGDELSTSRAIAHPIAEILTVVSRDIHPPLYFVLLHDWQALPLPWSGIAALRAFSVLWALLATLLLDRFWTRSLQPAQRWLALLIFAVSPCLLLYGRMARSYSMQMALSLLALAMLQRWARHPRSAISAAAALASLLGVLYTHYLPGLALLAGFVLTTWNAIGTARMAAFLLATGAGYAFWAATLLHAVGQWWHTRSFSSGYAITGNRWLEHLVKLGFGAVSLTIGESFFALSLALAPLVLLLAIWGAERLPRPTRWLLAIAAPVGYLGASRWVSYPFIPARLLWLLPFLCVLVALGISRLRRPLYRNGAILLILLSYASSDILYFRRTNFLNLGYAAPLPEITALLNREAQPSDLILVDSYNTDDQVILAGISVSAARSAIPGDISNARDRIRSAQAVWIVRNTRDVSPGGITARLQSEACAGRSQRVLLFEPFAPWQELALKIARIRPVPTHFYQITECGPPGRVNDTMKTGQ